MKCLPNVLSSGDTYTDISSSISLDIKQLVFDDNPHKRKIFCLTLRRIQFLTDVCRYESCKNDVLLQNQNLFVSGKIWNGSSGVSKFLLQ